MALQQQEVPINFIQGLDLKTDPFQIPIGKFLSLRNSIFTKGGLLQKRNGFEDLDPLPDATSKHITTFNGNLTAIGTSLNAYSNGSRSWVNKGSITPVSLSVLPLVRSNTTQSQGDVVVASNGLACVVYTDNIASNGTTAASYKYSILDSSTGQIIVNPTAITVASGSITNAPRVFLLGNYFILIFTNVISSVSHLQYCAININIPTTLGANTNISSTYTPATTLAFDAINFNNTLFIAYNGSDGGGAIRVNTLDTTLTLSSTVSFAGIAASLISCCADVDRSIIYITTYSGSTGYTFAVNPILSTVFQPVPSISVASVVNVTSSAQSGVCTIFYEVTNTYTSPISTASNYIQSTTVTWYGNTFKSVFSNGAGTITASSATGLVNGMYVVDVTTASHITSGTTFTISGTTLTLSQNTAGASASSPGDTMTAVTVAIASTPFVRSVGLASKSFILDGTIYMLAAFSSSFQPTYFLINSSGKVISRLAYQNGGGYLTTGLPNTTIIDSVVTIPYLFKDALIPVNKTQGATQQGAVFAQTGVNMVSFDFDSPTLSTAELGGNLIMSGGFLSMYDGAAPVEQNFFLFPDDCAVTAIDNITATVTTVNGSPTLTSVSSTANLTIGMNITGTGIPASTKIVSFTSNTITMDKNATANGTVTATMTGNMATSNTYWYSAVYTWADNQGNIFRSAPSIPFPAASPGVAGGKALSGSNTAIKVFIPTLRLTYKTASPVKIELFRLSTAQPIYYQTTTINNPVINSTTVDSIEFTDINSDNTISGNSILYTTGGVVEDTGISSVNALTIFKSRLFAILAEDPNGLAYSKQVIEGVPVEMSDLFSLYIPPTIGAQGNTGPVKTFAAMDDKLILFKKNAIYYMTGQGPDNTGAQNDFSDPVFITSTVGCANQNSIVFIPNGLLFQSDKGIWLLGRDLSTSYIGAPVEDFNSAVVRSALAIPGTNQVRFTLSDGTTLMYDYYYDQWGTFANIPGISSTLFEDLHTYLDQFGNVRQENPGSYLDGASPVLLSFATGWLKLTGLQGFQRAYEVFLLASYFSPHKLVVNLAYDYSPAASQQTIIAPSNYNANYGDGSQFYGDGDPYGGNPQLEQWKVSFDRQKCQAIQISLQEQYDSSLGAAPGAGFTMSGMNLVIGIKSGKPKLPAAQQAG